MTSGILEVSIPEGQAGAVENFQSANILSIRKINSVTYQTHPHFLPLSVSVCPSVLPPVLQTSDPHNSIPVCYVIPPSLPPHYKATPLNPYVCLSSRYTALYTSTVHQLLKPPLLLATISTPWYFLLTRHIQVTGQTTHTASL
jgi:hypothetical protein